jgi:uncharacterized metal-binding protein
VLSLINTNNSNAFYSHNQLQIHYTIPYSSSNLSYKKKLEGCEKWELRDHLLLPYAMYSKHVSQVETMMNIGKVVEVEEECLQVMKIEVVGLLSLVLIGKLLISLQDTMQLESPILKANLLLELIAFLHCFSIA